MNSSQQFATDVLIVGSGPTGGATALALATYGVRCHVISRWNWLAHSPRAHITNQRSMEVLRDLRLDEQVLKYATPWDQMGDMLFATSLAGDELVRIRAWGTGDERKGDYLEGSPCPMVDIIQPLLEPILFTNAAERGATFLCNTEYLSHEQDGEGVTVRLQDRLTERQYMMRARYLVGADGAKSKIVEDLGLNIEGHTARAGTAYIIFNADLSRYVRHRPSTLHWFITPSASFGEIGLGLLRAVRPWDQWIAGWGFDIAKGEPDLSEDNAVIEKIRALVGDATLDIEIVTKSIWYVNQAYATEYSKGHVFCAGDAVHRHPPSSGLGMNTCIQDGFNLAWKLAYVVKGYAGGQLLESYSAERQPVGKQIVERANQSRLDYAPLNAAFRVAGAQNPVAAGIARFRDPGPEGAQARRGVHEALELKNTEFNAQGIEMNQRYISSAVVADPSAGDEVWKRDKQLYLQATTRPGAKIPHAWLVNRHGVRVSTLDVIGKGQFSLVTGLAGRAWISAAEALALPYLRTVVVGERDTLDPYLEWQRRREIDEAGALLVRPDGYIAWRQREAVHDRAAANTMLSAALRSVLDQNGGAGT